jgi:hypothetical protein
VAAAVVQVLTAPVPVDQVEQAVVEVHISQPPFL